MTLKCKIGSCMIPNMQINEEFLAVFPKSSLKLLETKYHKYTRRSIAVKFNLASPQTHHVPQVALPHADPARRVVIVKSKPDLAFDRARASYFGSFLNR